MARVMRHANASLGGKWGEGEGAPVGTHNYTRRQHCVTHGSASTAQPNPTQFNSTQPNPTRRDPTRLNPNRLQPTRAHPTRPDLTRRGRRGQTRRSG